ncbi:MAG: 30S ribosomal protein S6, partial [Hyphomicrobiaceae bacterium]
YEHIFMARQDVSSQQVEAMTEEFTKIIEDAGGTIAKTEQWGVRPLAYKIKKNRKAHYTLLNIDSAHPPIAEMERQMQINADILRFVTFKVDEHDTEPSAVLRKSDRDDRRGGPGGRGGPRRDGPRPPRDDSRPPREENRPPPVSNDAAPAAPADE